MRSRMHSFHIIFLSIRLIVLNQMKKLRLKLTSKYHSNLVDHLDVSVASHEPCMAPQEHTLLAQALQEFVWQLTQCQHRVASTQIDNSMIVELATDKFLQR